MIPHKERKIIREQIAKHAEINGAQSACEHFDVSDTLVRSSCKEFGTAPAQIKGQSPKQSTYHIISELLQGKSQSDIARELSLSRQRVNQVAQNCKNAGINLP
jgi:DNA-binding NarL/FixJ family response regulator